MYVYCGKHSCPTEAKERNSAVLYKITNEKGVNAKIGG